MVIFLEGRTVPSSNAEPQDLDTVAFHKYTTTIFFIKNYHIPPTPYLFIFIIIYLKYLWLVDTILILNKITKANYKT
jgi:hypothetical protein